MNNGSRMSGPTQGDEDDWETAEIAVPSKAPPRHYAATLRPSAPEFKPRPPPTPAHAGPSAAVSRSILTRRDDGAGDDEWFAVRRPATNRQIWDSANAAASPNVLGSSSLGVPLGPPIPTMQILRRPNDRNASGKRVSAEDARRAKTLEEREEEYRLARERIFGSGSGPADAAAAGAGVGSIGGGPGGKSGSGRTSPVVLESSLWVVPSQVRRSAGSPAGAGAGKAGGAGNGVVRQPHGPGEGGGFGAR